MHKKQFLLLLLPMILFLAACSNTGGSTAAAQGQNQTGQPPDISNQPIEQRLAAGLLMLEGTENAITTEQAQNLLPLWKAVRAISSDNNAAQEELNAVYSQIQESMTAEQVQAIKDLSLSMEDTRALMEKYGIQLPQNPISELSESERATRIAEFQAGRGSQSGGQGATMPGGGGFANGMPPGSGGEMPGGRLPGSGSPEGAPGGRVLQGTPQPGQGGRGMRGGIGLLYIDPLIKLLTERAAE